MKPKTEYTITPIYRGYVLGLLTLLYVFNLVDRSILAILQEPIKDELDLSDAQLGMLTGLAFALFYATLAIPIARIADRGYRKIVITVSIGLWSLMTALCGAAQNFASLLVFRIGVAVGEAGGVPPAVSLISDYFPPAKRATAMAIYGFGPPLGLMVGLFAGGWLNEIIGWRNTLYLFGIAGIALVPVVYLTLRDLPPGFSDTAKGMSPPKSNAVSLIDVARTAWRLRAMRHLAAAGTVHGFATYSVMNWGPSFYVRVHDLGTAEVGAYLGILAGLGGGLGTLFGGVLADRLSQKDTRWYMWTPAIAMAALVPVSLAQYLVGDPYVSFAISSLAFFLGTVYIGPFFATAQSLVVPTMRATMQAILLMIFNIFGLSLGPFLTGVLSDILVHDFDMGDNSLRYALCAAILFNAWSAFHFLRGAKYLRAELERDRSAESMHG